MTEKGGESKRNLQSGKFWNAFCGGGWDGGGGAGGRPAARRMVKFETT